MKFLPHRMEEHREWIEFPNGDYMPLKDYIEAVIIESIFLAFFTLLSILLILLVLGR